MVPKSFVGTTGVRDLGLKDTHAYFPIWEFLSLHYYHTIVSVRSMVEADGWKDSLVVASTDCCTVVVSLLLRTMAVVTWILQTVVGRLVYLG